MKAIKQRASGCLFGLALGDALGARTEFMSIDEILRSYPPRGPQEPPSPLVTDDTQMTLAVGEALLEARRPYTAATLEEPLRRAFIAWNESPDNKDVSETLRAGIAQFQAALTHGHATGLAAADITAAAIADLTAGGDSSGLSTRLRSYALSQRNVYHEDWLGPLWKRSGSASPQTFIARGWDECLNVLDRLDTALKVADRESDPCLATGAGWVAEEAFSTGLLCFLLFPNDPVAAIRRAAVTSGDSDSIACLTGAFAGAALGLAPWPQVWVQRIEYHDRLTRIGAAWD